MKGKRRIFEDVEDRQQRERERLGPVSLASPNVKRRQARIWLQVLCALTVAMTVLGGLTRLTDSGLSITEWELASGILPPLNDAEWDVAFSKYQQTPEFEIQNSQMGLAEFKYIYWWEWSHRQLGRLVGVVWVAGFAWLVVTGNFSRVWIVRLLSLGVLGGLQGAIGWWMVSSGLSGRMVDVASYRLAVHLGLAFVILGLTFWYILLLGRDQIELMHARRGRDLSAERLSTGILAILFLQVVLGALVAGTDAGRAFPTWPLMNGELFPSSALDLEPMLANFFENPGLVQFNHRLIAYALTLFVLLAWWKGRATSRLETKRAFNFLFATVLLQSAVGILTAVFLAPAELAILHQLLAVLLLFLAIRVMFVARYPAASIQNRRTP